MKQHQITNLVFHVILVPIHLVLEHVKHVLQELIQLLLVLLTVLLVVVVKKLIVHNQDVIFVKLENSLMEVNANNAQTILILLIKELVLVIAADQVIKLTLHKMVVFLVILDTFQRMESYVKNVLMELIHQALELLLVMVVIVVEKYLIIHFVSSVCLDTSQQQVALVKSVKEIQFQLLLVPVVVLLVPMDLKLTVIIQLVFFVNPVNFHLVDHSVKIVH